MRQALSLFEQDDIMYSRFASLNHEIQQYQAAKTAPHQERRRIVCILISKVTVLNLYI